MVANYWDTACSLIHGPHFSVQHEADMEHETGVTGKVAPCALCAVLKNSEK